MATSAVIERNRLDDLEVLTEAAGHTAADVDHYVDLFARCMSDFVASDAPSA